MKYVPFIAFLNISDMLGSINAEHYYGKIKFRHDNQRSQIELTWPITAKEALYLNKKDGVRGYARYKTGDQSEKFYSPEQITKVAVKLFSKKYPNDFLINGDGCGFSAEALVYWPKEYNALATRINRLAATWKKVGGYGDWRGIGGDEKRASKIDATWYELLKPFFERKSIDSK